MPKRRIARLTQWNGEHELENVRWVMLREDGTPDFDAPARLDRPSARYGTRGGVPPTWTNTHNGRIAGFRSPADWVPVERDIRVLEKADPHKCDWRCMGAKPQGDCECECRGRNHGRNFICDLAA